MFFQQLKRLHESLLGTSPSGEVSFGLGAFASATAVAFMIPMDTIKTRLVTQVISQQSPLLHYCASLATPASLL